jgi:predicted alpha-1,6-mannanase (GH76 family)
LRKPEWSDVDEALLKWFKQQRSDNVPVSGPLLMVKAEEFAKKLVTKFLIYIFENNKSYVQNEAHFRRVR